MNRWTEQQAQTWFDAQGPQLGANFVPANAINMLAMWQADSFDTARIDLELGWAAGLGMNRMRVFLHDLLWQQDAEGFLGRIDTYLDIAARHGIKTMLVLFDSCWNPLPRLGPQRPPIPGVHNSGWCQAPGAEVLGELDAHLPRLQAYVEGVVGRFAGDERVWTWDIWNEPDNPGGGMGFYDSVETPKKMQSVERLLPLAFGWARNARPVQPLTSGVWLGEDWAPASELLTPIQRIQLEQSDVTSFHDYSWPEKFEARVKQLQAWGRPLLCTEYMARGNGSTFDASLPIAAQHNVAMINWGFVDGLSQTKFPWDSWIRPYGHHPQPLWQWFHDVLHGDGKPYREREVELLRAFAAGKLGR